MICFYVADKNLVEELNGKIWEAELAVDEGVQEALGELKKYD